MEKQEWEMWVTEPNPCSWQYKAAAISWLALAVHRLWDIFPAGKFCIEINNLKVSFSWREQGVNSSASG